MNTHFAGAAENEFPIYINHSSIFIIPRWLEGKMAIKEL